MPVRPPIISDARFFNNVLLLAFLAPIVFGFVSGFARSHYLAPPLAIAVILLAMKLKNKSQKLCLEHEGIDEQTHAVLGLSF